MFRPLFVGMAVLAVFSPYSASAQAGGAQCHATPQETRRAVPWAGNTGDISWSADKPDCNVDAGGSPWIAISVLPPSSNNPTQRVLRYSVNTNFAASGRQGTIQIGDTAVTIEQAAGPAPGMAFSPSRLEFQLTPGKNNFPVAVQLLYVGSEQPLVYTATPDKTAPWVQVKATGTAGNTAQRQRAFEVTVSAAGKDPGVYQTDILLEAPNAANPKELVPVMMVVEKAK